MKKFYLVFAVAMLALAFASCHKDGQYKPKNLRLKARYKPPPYRNHDFLCNFATET